MRPPAPMTRVRSAGELLAKTPMCSVCISDPALTSRVYVSGHLKGAPGGLNAPHELQRGSCLARIARCASASTGCLQVCDRACAGGAPCNIERLFHLRQFALEGRRKRRGEPRQGLAHAGAVRHGPEGLPQDMFRDVRAGHMPGLQVMASWLAYLNLLTGTRATIASIHIHAGRPICQASVLKIFLAWQHRAAQHEWGLPRL